MQAGLAGRGACLVLLGLAAGLLPDGQSRTRKESTPPARVIVHYPEEGTVFPPDFAPPTFLWQELAEASDSWEIEVHFSSGASPLRVRAAVRRPEPGPVDPAAAGPTNRPPELSPEERASWAWKPDAALWEEIRRGSLESPATVTITGTSDGKAVSRGSVRILTSRDPVGAPVFYRDVPLMPSETEKGVIKPLAPRLLPLVKWRLRYVDETESRVVLDNLHTCANCHSFSADGRTLGMDLDGPHNDKGLYAIVPLQPRTEIRNEHVISWKKFRNQMERDKRIGFMSQVSPDGRFVITATQVQYYVANFRDYRFLQVFYPTRGILAWYDRLDGVIRPLPGADDPRYVHANAVWSPDGSYLVFSRAPATEAYPPGKKLAEFPNDPNEVQIRYDLYRIPFRGGAGGRAEPVRGASANGMSNTFPKISPDGRWIVFVKCRNGQLMRPDGELWIVPAAGGEARRMRCNTRLMNSWHSFSPNGRWLVFSSKSRSPYTQLFLAHIDENGMDSPPVLIEDATAANRAANIPEFVNIGKGGLERITAPAAEFYRLYDIAYQFTEAGRMEEALRAWREALRLEPDDAKANNNLGGLLLRQGQLEEAEALLRKSLAADPELVGARNNLGLLLMQRGRWEDARREFEQALRVAPSSAEARVNLGAVLLVQGRPAEAVRLLREVLAAEPWRTEVRANLAWILATSPDASVRDGREAVRLAEEALALG
ncbi:MAG: tetratricopeptide repeat protein, partial [Planctomycetota bacterium]|nr:tetratricopeptide repeat protein [Planctomycetota bacterium]